MSIWVDNRDCDCMSNAQIKKKLGHGILIMKANEMHYFSNLFDKAFYMFRTRPLSIIRSISTLCTRNRYLLF